MNVFKKKFPSRFGFTSALASCRASFSFFHSSPGPDTCIEIHSQEQEVVIALGSNVGDRLKNFNEALHQMKKSGIQITRHACLYETTPAYVTNQPLFLNSAVRATTKLGPHELLASLKKIEKEMGRTKGIRYGPRPIDLDILFYGKYRINSETLTIPHERIWERPFVMAPLVDLLGLNIDSDIVLCWHALAKNGVFESWEELGGESLIGKDGVRRVLPVGNGLWDWSKKTSVMGILNLTPDSFSDGGKFQSLSSALPQIQAMISEGADIIDLGAQSTRPMASRVSAEEELDRLMPVLEEALKLPEMEGKLVSVDTFYAEVASEAISAGAHIVNDVSGGELDSNMLRVVAGGVNVPYVVMHMRGDPCTMENHENLKYDDVCEEVGDELYDRVRKAELCGVPGWRVILDPGLGFSKKTEDNVGILRGLGRIRGEIARRSLGVSRAPLLIGPSRKRFLGEVCGRASAGERDPATVAAVTAAVLGGADIVRVHNVRDNADAVKLCRSIMEHVTRGSSASLID